MRTPLARERRTRASRASAYLCVETQEPSRASWALLGARLPVLYSFAVGQKKIVVLGRRENRGSFLARNRKRVGAVRPRAS